MGHLNLLIFDGMNPVVGYTKLICSFIDKLKLASMHKQGDALAWLKWVKSRERFINREELKKISVKEFRSFK